MKDKRALSYDWGLMAIYLALMVLGLFNLLSATSPTGAGSASEIFGNPSNYFKLQVFYSLLGLVMMLIITRFDYRIMERMAYPIFALSIVLLILVLVIGDSSSGSSRWIQMGGFRLQPSEIGKIALILVLAKFFHNDRHGSPYGIVGLLWPLLLISIPLVLLYLEPDLGTALFYVLISISLILFVGVKSKHLIVLAAGGIVAAILSFQFLLHDYQQDRIKTFLNPELDPLGKGYHAIQSQIAIGSGRFLGKGYLAGSQSQLKFLPEQHTDFIFSVLAEEWGFFGCFVLLMLYFGLLAKGITIASKARESFGALLGMGLVAILFWQIIVNLGGVLGLMPITGITLPFLSYGGSSIITLSLAIGLLQNISVRRFMF